MCGIAGAYLRDPKLDVDLDAMLNTMLDSIEHRGGDATGYLALDTEGVAEWHRAACDVPDFVKYRRPVPKGTRTILAHTRWATQGLPAFIENNHPIRRGSFYVIHNGHVSNDQKLFELAGRRPFGQVDSEAIPARLASLGSLEDAAIAMEEIEGAAAIAAVDEANPDELLLAKGQSSPLFVLVTNRIVLWGSTEATVKVAYKKHIGRLPKKRRIESLDPGTMIHFKNGVQTRTTFEVYVPKWKPTYSTKYAWQETTEAASLSHSDACLVPIESTRHLPSIGGWPKWDEPDADEEDQLRCDICDSPTSIAVADYETDADGSVWILCPSCSRELELDVSDDPAVVNAAILAEDEDDQ